VTDDASKDDDAKGDEDRAAILARRQRFIALAIGAFGATACDRCGPEPCLRMTPVHPDASAHAGPVQASPQPSFVIEPPREEVAADIELARPHPCLQVVRVPDARFTTGFRADASALDDDAKPALDRAADVLQAHPEVVIEVAGHTDDRGSPERRMQLSLARAEAVREYLITKGIAAERMTVQAYGGEYPLAPNDGATNRAKNNRVELSVRE
jgi:outer membrane protein OmpA-like peptidoglycan-associated protein